MLPAHNATEFKVYRSTENSVYSYKNKADIESAFIEYIKINPDLKFG